MNINFLCGMFFILAVYASLSQKDALIVWFFLVNLLTFFAYGIDKYAAKKGWRRLPELTLLSLGFSGGWPGAMCGQEIFRHKTQKQPFRRYFLITVIANIFILSVLGALYWRYLHG